MRALAAYGVLATHAGFNSGRSLDSGPFAPLLARLDFGVTVFFLLSGFLLYRPFAAAALAGTPTAAMSRRFYLRRALRILPAYWLAVLVTLGWLSARTADGGDWASYLLLVQTYNHHNLDPSLTQMWTLAVEISFYAVLPPLALAARGRRRAAGSAVARQAALLLGLVAVAVASNVAAHHGRLGSAESLIWLPANLDWFAAGMALALLSCLPAGSTAGPGRTAGGSDRSGRSNRTGRVGGLGRRPGSAAGRNWPPPGTCWALGGLLFWLAYPAAGRPAQPAGAHRLGVDGQARALRAWPLFALLLPLTLGSGGLIGRLLSSAPLRLLGQLSYGVYLWHLPLLLAIQRGLGQPPSAVTSWSCSCSPGWPPPRSRRCPGSAWNARCCGSARTRSRGWRHRQPATGRRDQQRQPAAQLNQPAVRGRVCRAGRQQRHQHPERQQHRGRQPRRQQASGQPAAGQQHRGHHQRRQQQAGRRPAAGRRCRRGSAPRPPGRPRNQPRGLPAGPAGRRPGRHRTRRRPFAAGRPPAGQQQRSTASAPTSSPAANGRCGAKVSVHRAGTARRHQVTPAASRPGSPPAAGYRPRLACQPALAFSRTASKAAAVVRTRTCRRVEPQSSTVRLPGSAAGRCQGGDAVGGRGQRLRRNHRGADQPQPVRAGGQRNQVVRAGHRAAPAAGQRIGDRRRDALSGTGWPSTSSAQPGVAVDGDPARPAVAGASPGPRRTSAPIPIGNGRTRLGQRSVLHRRIGGQHPHDDRPRRHRTGQRDPAAVAAPAVQDRPPARTRTLVGAGHRRVGRRSADPGSVTARGPGQPERSASAGESVADAVQTVAGSPSTAAPGRTRGSVVCSRRRGRPLGHQRVQGGVEHRPTGAAGRWRPGGSRAGQPG